MMIRLSLLSVATMLLLTGCGRPSAATRDHLEDAPLAGANHEIPAGMAELEPADRELALAQKVCPVTNAPLGTMGKPYKMTVAGRTVFLCCQGCEASVAKDPEAALAKLKR